MRKERAKLDRAVHGALRSAIHDHGSITERNVNSASKRVTGELLTFLDQVNPETVTVERLRVRLEEARFANRRMQDQITRLRARLAEFESEAS